MNQFHLQKLANQLQVVTVPMAHVKSVTVLALVKAGTRLETEKTNGISHFLEHMVFKGTRKYASALKLASAVDAVGAEINAFTSKEYTGFYVKSAADHLALALEIVGELVFNPLMPEKELETERGVILEEIRMYEDQPMAKIKMDFETLLYSNTSLGWLTLGREENINNLSLQDFSSYRKRLYRPRRMLLALAGNDQAVKGSAKLVKQYFGEQGGNLTDMEVNKKLVFNQSQPGEKIIRKKTEQAHLCLGVRTYAKGDSRRYRLAVLSSLLGGGMSSRLFTEIREKRGLAYYVRSGVQTYSDNGYLVMQAGTEAKNIKQVVKLALSEFNKVKQGRFSLKELKKAKEYLKGQFVLSLEDSQSLADLYGEDILIEGKPRTPAEIIKATNQVTKEEVQAVAEEIFIDQRLNLAVITPEEPKGTEKALQF